LTIRAPLSHDLDGPLDGAVTGGRVGDDDDDDDDDDENGSDDDDIGGPTAEVTLPRRRRGTTTSAWPHRSRPRRRLAPRNEGRKRDDRNRE
jgi:hypothetical protein